MKGTVKWFNNSKGYGFISGEDSKEYFVHKSALAEGVMVQEGNAVEFEPATNERGLQATKVVLA